MSIEKKGIVKNGKFIYVVNHRSYLDAITIFPAIGSHFRTLGKAGLENIPFYGYFYRQAAISVDRKNAKSRIMSMRTMWRHLETDGSIVIFPEGTFNESEAPLKSFYDGAFRLAIATQTPIYPIVFPDATDRWHFSSWWKLWPGRNRAIYLEVFPVAGLKKEDAPVLRQKVYARMEKALKDAQTG